MVCHFRVINTDVNVSEPSVSLLHHEFMYYVGLDPALPLYATPVDGKKLDKSDADFVDVIHTSVGIFGKLEPSGHSDFYVNGVAIQPGCYLFQVSSKFVCQRNIQPYYE